MKNKSNYPKKKKGQGRALTITLLISGIIMTGLVIFLWMNEWSIEKSTQRAQELIGMATPKKETQPSELPEKNIEIEPKDKGAGSTEGTEQTPEQKPTTPPATPAENGEPSTVKLDNGGYIEGQQLPEKPIYIQNILIANKKYPLPSTFAPGEDKTARAAFDQMAAEAALAGFNLTAFSTYRGFDYQTTLYDRYVARDGKEAADTYSARPGYSEHQTGLAFDIGEVNFEKHWASSSFGDTDAGKWVAANAHRFGFIMRYPKGKEQITGYMHEAWHFRYVGIEIADVIFKNNSTLEEYLGI